MKRCSRIVVLPDYQGVGIGNLLLNMIAQHYTQDGYRFTITTTTPALIYSFKNNNNWKLTRQGRVARGGSTSSIETAKKISGSSSTNRITTSWEYIRTEGVQ